MGAATKKLTMVTETNNVTKKVDIGIPKSQHVTKN